MKTTSTSHSSLHRLCVAMSFLAPMAASSPVWASFKAGNLYVNVDSDAYKGGEIRGPIKP